MNKLLYILFYGLININFLSIDLFAQSKDNQTKPIVDSSLKKEAYNYYIQAREKHDSFEVNDLYKAIELYKKTIQIDPGFYFAYSGLSELYSRLLYIYYIRDFNLELLDLVFSQKKELQILSFQAAEKSMRINPLSFLSNKAMAYHYWVRSMDSTNSNREKDRISALKFIQEANTINPKDASTQWLLYAIHLIEKENSDLYKKANKLNSKHFESNLYQGDIHLLKGDFSKSISMFKMALSIQPDHVDANISLSIAYRKNKQFKESLSILQNIQNKLSNNDFYYSVQIAKARIYRDMEDYEKSEASYQNVLEIEPKNFYLASRELSQLYSNLHRKDKWGLIYQKAIKKNPNDKDRYFTDGAIIYYHRDQEDLSLKYLSKSIKLKQKKFKEDNLEYAYTLAYAGKSLILKGDYDKSLKYLHKSLDIYSNFLGIYSPVLANIYLNIGYAHYGKQNYNESVNYFNKALNLFKGGSVLDLANIYNNLGLAHNNRGEYTIAIEFHNKALDIYKNKVGIDHPDTGIIYNNLGLVYYNNKEYQKSILYYEKALDIYKSSYNSDHPMVAICYGNIAYVYQGMSKKAESIQYFQKAISVKNIADEDLEIYKNEIDTMNSGTDIGSGNTEDTVDNIHDHPATDEVMQKTTTTEKSKISTQKIPKTKSEIYGLLSELNSKSNTDDIETAIYKAKLYTAVGESHTALVYYKKILEKDPNRLDINLEIGREYFRLKNYTKTKIYLQKATSLVNDDYKIVHEIGKKFISMRDFDLAQEAYERLLLSDKLIIRAKGYRHLGDVARYRFKSKQHPRIPYSIVRQYYKTAIDLEKKSKSSSKKKKYR